MAILLYILIIWITMGATNSIILTAVDIQAKNIKSLWFNISLIIILTLMGPIGVYGTCIMFLEG